MRKLLFSKLSIIALIMLCSATVFAQKASDSNAEQKMTAEQELYQKRQSALYDGHDYVPKKENNFTRSVKENAEKYQHLEGEIKVSKGVRYIVIPLNQWTESTYPPYARKGRENVHVYGSPNRVDKQTRYLQIPVAIVNHEALENPRHQK